MREDTALWKERTIGEVSDIVETGSDVVWPECGNERRGNTASRYLRQRKRKRTKLKTRERKLGQGE